MNNNNYTHKDLCDIAVKWLKRPSSQKGHGCAVAVSEVKADFTGEIPDAIVFRTAYDPSSVVVEVKVGRGDFLQDHKKPHRHDGGMGNFRYFMCPTGLIKEDELPDKWGLLYVNNRGHIKVIKGPVKNTQHYFKFNEEKEKFRFDSNTTNEMMLLVKLFNRIGDEEKLSNMLKEHTNRASKFEKEMNKYKEDYEKEVKLRRKLECKLEGLNK